ncbi:MAG: hypothetical protein IIC73_01640 [Armatimonadetes bacterium]|nr:hypothetical protein [Armatimonadota bacterium]
MWSGIAVLGVLLLGLLIYVKACEKPIEGFSPATETELLTIADDILGDRPSPEEQLPIMGLSVQDIQLSESSQQALDTVLDERPFPPMDEESLAQLDGMILVGIGAPRHDPVLNVRARMALVRAYAGNNVYLAATRAFSASLITSLAVDTAFTVDEWMQAQGARLLFIQAMSASLEHDGWQDEAKKQVLKRLEAPSHRAALGRVLHRRFIEQRIPEIAEASNTTDMAQTVADALIEDPTEDETKLISALLKRHPRAFSPEATAESGAESVRQIAAALEGPWYPSEKTLDLVASGQSAWTTFFDVLNADDALAILQIKQLKEQIDALENPVGLALLHRGRTGWASLVQSAYVADAKEALFKIALLTKAGKDDEAVAVLDPLTGEPYDLEGGFAKSKPTDIGDPYGFLKAFAQADHPL